jgi:hypothetical protein
LDSETPFVGDNGRERAGPSFVSRAGRMTLRLIVLFLFLQLFLWLFVGRKSLIQLAPDMIVDDVHSVAMLGVEAPGGPVFPERIYVISEGLADAIGEERLYALSASLGRFNGTVMAEDDGTYIERANQDGCGDCLFVGIRQVVNTPFVARSYTSYTRPLLFSQLHGIEQRTQEREHTYVWVLGRWIPVRTTWLAS